MHRYASLLENLPKCHLGGMTSTSYTFCPMVLSKFLVLYIRMSFPAERDHHSLSIHEVWPLGAITRQSILSELPLFEWNKFNLLKCSSACNTKCKDLPCKAVFCVYVWQKQCRCFQIGSVPSMAVLLHNWMMPVKVTELQLKALPRNIKTGKHESHVNITSFTWYNAISLEYHGST